MPFQTLQAVDALSFIENERPFVLDVRTPAEFAERHLPGASNIPVDSIPQNLDKIPTDKTLVIYCLHGSRSKLAANFLSARNYPKVYHIEGGFEALRQTM